MHMRQSTGPLDCILHLSCVKVLAIGIWTLFHGPLSPAVTFGLFSPEYRKIDFSRCSPVKSGPFFLSTWLEFVECV